MKWNRGASPNITPYYDFLREQIEASGTVDESLQLPGDAPREPGKVHFSSGSLDGIMTHHAAPVPEEELVRSLVEAIEAAAQKPASKSRAKLEKLIASQDAVSVVDALCEQLSRSVVPQEAIRALAAHLCLTAHERNLTKIGLAILGTVGVEPHADIVRVLGAHSDFTLFAVVAFRNGHPDAEREIWALAQLNEAWGRVHAVERLEHTEDPAIKDWILRGGFRNGVMDEYLAYIAVETGGAIEALKGGPIDDELLTALSQVIPPFITGGPARDIGSFEDAPELLSLYLDSVEGRGATVTHFVAIRTVRNYLQEIAAGTMQAAASWLPGQAQELCARASAQLTQGHWRDVAEAALAGEDSQEKWHAARMLQECGGDPYSPLVGAIRSDPFAGPWYQAWQYANTEQAEELADLCAELLKPQELATGATADLSFGEKYQVHREFEWTLQALSKHIGLGPELIEAGLQFPTIHARQHSINALKVWADRPERLEALVREVALSDPSEHVRKNAAECVAEWDAA